MTRTGLLSWAIALAVLWAVSVAFVAPIYGQTQRELAAPCPGVLSDSDGEIAEVLLHYDPELAGELEPVYRTMFRTLSDGVRVIMICPSLEAAVECASDWHTELTGREVEIINVGFPLSIWARDRYVSRQTLDLLQRAEGFVPITDTDNEPEKHNDLLALELLGLTRLMPPVLDSALFIEGGNVVANARNVFIGANVVVDNVDLAQDDLASELERLSGRPYVVVGAGDGEVPWCHADMYLTPIDDRTVLVASPRMAEELGFPVREDEGASADEDSTVTCVGDALQQRFDDVAEHIKRLGYRVLRIPAVITSPGESMITYNNVIMDHRGGRRVVYMPTYDVPKLDNAAAAVYRHLGFEVHGVDVSAVFHRGGALRCLVNVTERQVAGASRDEIGKTRRIRFRNLAGHSAYQRLLSGADHRLARRGRRHARPLWLESSAATDVAPRPPAGIRLP